MEILILGGTGAMGEPLVSLLAKDEKNVIYVTTRQEKPDYDNVQYISGNAKDLDFLTSILNRAYDAIIDFMVYSTPEFEKRAAILLSCTKQYVFFSSARCYASIDGRIKENDNRLVDVCSDSDYLATDEYGLAKGREENLLVSGKKKNWTIIRPYITYNDNRIQLGVYEKEHWLRRALAGRTIVIPRDIINRKTTLTYGPDVANVLSRLIGNEDALGQIFNITTSETHTWKEILDFYSNTIYELTGKHVKVKVIDDVKGLQGVWNKWQIQYDRLS